MNNTKKLTVKEFAAILETDYPTAMGMIKLLVSLGGAKEAGKRATPGQKGKPSILYEIDRTSEFIFWNEDGSPIVKEEEVNTEPDPVAAETPEASEPAPVVEVGESEPVLA